MGGAWLTRRRLLTGATILLIIEIALLMIVVAATHGLVGKPKTRHDRFCRLLCRGSLTDAGTAALAYDQMAHRAAEAADSRNRHSVRLFLLSPYLPIGVRGTRLVAIYGAFLAFQITTLSACLVAIRAILRETRWTALLRCWPFARFFGRWALDKMPF